jgi:membrane-associated phospholipid phosphatase
LLNERPTNNFGIAFLLAIIFATATGVVLILLGKNETFQLINGNHNIYSDQFFKYFTHYGDGWMWVPLGLFCIFFRKKYIVAVIAGVIISTILAQFLKRVVFPDELRPIKYMADNFPIHLIDGVEMRTSHSFPSGHTTTAFTMALIMAHMINKKFWSVLLPLLALLAGYSRVYLAQHFPTDVLAGMSIGIISSILSLLIYRAFIKQVKKRASSKNKILHR